MQSWVVVNAAAEVVVNAAGVVVNAAKGGGCKCSGEVIVIAAGAVVNTAGVVVNAAGMARGPSHVGNAKIKRLELNTPRDPLKVYMLCDQRPTPEAIWGMVSTYSSGWFPPDGRGKPATHGRQASAADGKEASVLKHGAESQVDLDYLDTYRHTVHITTQHTQTHTYTYTCKSKCTHTWNSVYLYICEYI
jgi:hypothetical protein